MAYRTSDEHTQRVMLNAIKVGNTMNTSVLNMLRAPLINTTGDVPST